MVCISSNVPVGILEEIYKYYYYYLYILDMSGKLDSRFISFKNSGLFYQVSGDDAILLYYLFNIKIKNGIGYIARDKINKVLLVLDKLYINYIYFDNYHKFTNNRYEYYLEYAYKKYDIKRIIDLVYE